MTYSIIQKSQLEGSHRLDAEYYQPEYLNAVKKIKSLRYTKLGDIISVLTDYHANGSYQSLKKNVTLLDTPDYALMIRAVDIQTDNFSTSVKYVDQKAYEFLTKSKIIGKEVLIDKIGNAGEVYFMPELKRPVTLGMNLFMIRPKLSVSSEYIYSFLTCKFGRALTFQKLTGTSPLSIDKHSVRNILIPLPSKEFESKIIELISKSYRFKTESINLYSQAENTLLTELGLNDFKIQDDLFSIVSLEEVKMAKRLDAEYFQQKYQQLFKSIRKHNLKILDQLVTVKKGIEPGSEAYQEEGRQFIRVSSLSKFGIEQKDQQFLNDDLYRKFKKDFEPKVGEILLTKDATPGIAYTVKESVEGIISGGILRLSIKSSIEPEYLTLCVNSIIGKWQAERDSGGSVIAHWKTDQIKNVLIPILPIQTQQKIADLVKKSHEARKKSNELLEEAKQKVEEMIEKSI